MSERVLMKDGLGPEAVEKIILFLQTARLDFSAENFRAQALDGLEDLELRARVSHLMGVLRRHLPDDFPQAAAILARLADHWDQSSGGHNMSMFAAWPLVDYVGEYGLDTPGPALATLCRMTPVFSAEFAVRPFWKHQFEITHQQAAGWCEDGNPAVRRLASEGSRPRLPWGLRLQRFVADPGPVLELLEKLKDDPDEVVRRSVANNLNDISKDHPDTVLTVGRRWLKGAGAERRGIIRHATRTLVKAGHPEVFALLGFTSDPKVEVRRFELSRKSVAVGEKLEFGCEVASRATGEQSLVLDYAVHYRKADGSARPKVFKLRTLKIGAGETVAVRKSQSFKPVSTRKLYTGRHAIELLINGVAVGKRSFTLTD